MYINMAVNSSSLDDVSLLPPQLSPSNSSLNLHSPCYKSKMSFYAFSAIFITYLLLLPLLILVLYLGFQQWRRQRSISTATRSHSDIFTYHSIGMQLNELLGFAVFAGGIYSDLPLMRAVGLFIKAVTSLGHGVFHLLTCVERYLAVVHPITYLGLRQASGVRIRNISIGCVWFLSVGFPAVMSQTSFEFNFIVYMCSMVFFLALISFCSISVLCALKRPGPGEVGGNRERVDQSKQRAFYTIMAIMGVLLFRFAASMITYLMYSLSVFNDSCIMLMSGFWYSLPSTLVLPLLFLHRAGKLQCCKQNTESGSA